MIVEDGTGLSNANSYVSVAEADAYFTSIGDTDWLSPEVTNDAKEVALVRATRSIDLLFADRFDSYPKTSTQRLQFPRALFYIYTWQPVEGIPRILKEAVCEIALKSILDEDILPGTSTEAAVKSTKLKIGSFEEQFEYGSATTVENLSGFYEIELLLKPLLTPGGNLMPAYLTL